jgi:zinc and cadmium transporter
MVVDGVAGLAGGLFSEGWLKRHLSELVGFAAGALIAAVFLDVLPESVARLDAAALDWAFGGFVGLAILEWALGQHHHGGEGRKAALPPALLLSDALHNIGDGIAIAAAFLASTRAGIGISLAVIAHEVPQEIGDYALLRAAGMSRSRAVLWLALVQLTAGVGAVGVWLASEASRNVSAVLIAIASGTFLYIAATDLLPEIHSGPSASERRKRLFGFLLGICLIVITVVLDRTH